MKELQVKAALQRRYSVVSAENLDELQRVVAQFMDAGFIPSGSFTYAPSLPGKDNYFQAVYKPK